MSNPIPLKPGDIAGLSTSNNKAEELVKHMVLKAAQLNIRAAEALGAASGFVVYIVSHFKTDEDRLAAVTAFIAAVQASCSGDFVVPLSQMMTDIKKNTKDFDKAGNPINRDANGNIIR
jgi:hypothetical protein